MKNCSIWEGLCLLCKFDICKLFIVYFIFYIGMVMVFIVMVFGVLELIGLISDFGIVIVVLMLVLIVVLLLGGVLVDRILW